MVTRIAPTTCRARLALPGLAALLLALCLGTPAHAQLKTVNVGIAQTASDVGFFIADKKGYFREQGIEVKTTPFASAALMVAPLGAGQLDVGGGTVAAGLYNAVSAKINVKIVADKGSIKEGYEFSTLVIRKDLVDEGKFKSYKDLKGWTIATAAQGAGSESQLNEALKKGGLKYDDVKVVYMSFPQQLAALSNKGIDAGVTVEPTITRAEKDGVAVRSSKSVIYPGQQNAVVLYSEGFIAQRPLAEKFMVAYLKAVRDYNDALKDGRLAGPNAKEIIDILTEYTAVKDAKIYAEITPNACDPDGNVNVATLKNDFTFFKQRGYIDAAVKIGVEDVIDNSFAAAAVKQLGPYKKK
jgi:NitT/TauT family transport system substrate-binding protein